MALSVPFALPTAEMLGDQLHNPENCDLYILTDRARLEAWVATHRPLPDDKIECTCVPEHWMKRTMREILEKSYARIDWDSIDAGRDQEPAGV